MNFEDVVEAMNELREDNFQEETLYLSKQDHDDLLEESNFVTATSMNNQPSAGSVGQVAGVDVELHNKRASILEGKSAHSVKGVPVMTPSGYTHHWNGHHLVESETHISCIDCDIEFEIRGFPIPDGRVPRSSARKWAHGWFLANDCEPKDLSTPSHN